MLLLWPEELKKGVSSVLQAEGTPADIAESVSASLVGADLAGHGSHGVVRLPGYVAEIRAGRLDQSARPQVKHERASVALMDARNGWGHYAAGIAMSFAMEKASEYGVGCVALTRCTHIGRLGEFVELAARSNCIGLIVLGYGGRDLGWSAPYGGKSKMLMTNPVAIGVPGGEDRPFVLDIATTAVSRGKIEVVRDRGDAVPEGWILDSEGHPTNRPEDFFNGGFLNIFGGHKGYGLSLATCLLGGLGGAFNPQMNRIGGIYLQAIDIGSFLDAGTYITNVRNFLAEVRQSEAAREGESVLVPGDMEAANRDRTTQNGVSVSIATWKALGTLFEAHSVEPPSELAT